MKVYELVAALSEYDGDAEVVFSFGPYDRRSVTTVLPLDEEVCLGTEAKV
jgi:hypothetical protein